MTSAEDYPDHVDDAEQLLRAVLTRHHIERIPLPDGTLRLRISRDFFLPFRSDEIGLSAFRELAGKDTIRRHADSMFSYCGFGRTQCADMREIDAEVEAAGMDGIQRTPPFCGSWLPWLACTGISGRGAPAVRLPLPLPRYRRIVGWMACRAAGSPAVA